MIKIILVPVVFGFILGGCAITDDPGKGGFVDGVVALFTGAYEKRAISKKHELYNKNLNHLELAKEKLELDQEMSLINTQLNNAEERMDILDKEINDLIVQIKSAKIFRDEERKKHKKLKMEINTLNREITQLSIRNIPSDQSLVFRKQSQLKSLKIKGNVLEKTLQDVIDVY